MDAPGSYVPARGSAPYASRSYWDWRFGSEEAHEWLASWSDVRALVAPLLPAGRASRILLVGCGNSPMAADMADDGYTSIVASDYAPAVIRAMRVRCAASHPAIQWAVADMTSLTATFAPASFDAVLDKAAMDAVLADGGDAWDPPPDLLAVGRRIVAQAGAVLRPGGAYIQISFAQPHFRRKYLVAPPTADSGYAMPAGRGADGNGGDVAAGDDGGEEEGAYAFDGHIATHKVDCGFGYALFAMRRRAVVTDATAAPASLVVM